MRMHILLSTAAFLACGDSLQPADVVGSYTLATIADQAPPRTIVDEPDCRITVVGGSLSLTADQQFELLLQEDEACPTPTAPGQVTELWAGSYGLDGTAVVLHVLGDSPVDIRAPVRTDQVLVPLGSRYGEVAFSPNQ